MDAATKMLRGLLFGAGGFALLLAWSLFAARPSTPGDEISLDQANAVLAAPAQITGVVFYDVDSRIGISRVDGSKLWVAYPSGAAASAEFVTDVADRGVPVSVDQQWSKRLWQTLSQFVLPLLLLADLFGIFILIARGGGSQVKDLFAFSRLPARSTAPSSTTRFADAAAAGNAVVELAEVVSYLKAPARFASMGAQPPKGVLLYGPPGCGKTLLARAVAGEASVPFYSISGSEFVESLVGVGAARVRDLFRQAMETAPAIIFIDELDAAGRRRGAGVGGGHDEREQTLNEMLVQMDGFSPNTGVVVIGATNRPDILDPALLRPGRFDRQILVEPPDRDGRLAILQLHAKRYKLGPDADLAQVAASTAGFSGADLASVLNEAGLLAVRGSRTSITNTDLDEAAHRVQIGPQRQGRYLTDDEKQRLAYHEAGHVIVAAAVGHLGDVQRVSIVARGRDGARTNLLPHADRAVLSEPELRAELAVTLAGIAAEIIGIGFGSSAGEFDLEHATELARRYAGRLGLSEEVGRVQVLRREAEVFLGRDLLADHAAASLSLDALDTAVRRLTTDAETAATEMLTERRWALDTLASALVEHETLDQREIAQLLAEGPPTTKPRTAKTAQKRSSPTKKTR